MEQLSASEIAQRPAPPNDPTGVLHRCEEMPDLTPTVQQVDIVEERHGGAAGDPVVKVMVKEYDAADTPVVAGDADTIPALEADFVPRDFTRLAAWDLDRNERVMSEFDGKVKLITNVASLCDTTRTNYQELMDLYDRFLPQGFEILAFPCRQFNNEEYKHPDEIKDFLSKYNVSFPVFGLTVVNGPETHPIFRYCKWNSEELYQNGSLGDIEWNFGKFLLDRDNRVYKYYGPENNPLLLVEDIKKLLRGTLQGRVRGPDGKLSTPRDDLEGEVHWS
ncbi:peroxiredoxin prx2 [Cystoisospora suis]|uniref:Glutathione peroxidase n=1 Tax=Cystoisospora suis TaxID=483139 RepID=A0A2C6KDK7_9APIC|nr:peroxiredoxin prx2 [Cystoisospora suis]